MPTLAQARLEQLMQRRATREFISSHPIRVRLTRTTKSRDTLVRGGTIPSHEHSLPEQTFRIAHGPPRRRRQENNQPHPQHAEVPFGKDLLVGAWDADILIGDTFQVGAIGYKVSYVFQDRDYETIANIETLTQGTEVS